MPANHTPKGWGFGGAAFQRAQSAAAALARENARRLPCPDCGLAVLPESLARHRDIVHGEDEA